MIETLLALYVLCMLGMFAYSLLQLHLTFIHRRLRRAGRGAPVESAKGELPLITVQLPIYNERYVAARLLDCVGKLDYPSDRFEIQVLDDSTDDTPEIVARKLAELTSRGLRAVHLRRTARSGYKAGALRDALPHAAGEFIAIFDADFCPAPDVLRKATPWFRDPRVAAVQLRWGFLNEDYSLLTRLQAFVLRAHFGVEQPARRAWGLFANFNGSGGLWRRSAIDDAGGWRADTITEDLDLSYRAQFKGWRIEFLEHEPCDSELPVDMEGFRSQQFRWMKGGAQNARLHLGRVLRSRLPLLVKLHACGHLLASSFYLLVLATVLLSVPLAAAGNAATQAYTRRYAAAFLLAVPVAAALLHEAQDRPYTAARFLAMLAGWFVFSLGMCLHSASAAFHGWLGGAGEFVRTPKHGIVGARGDWSKSAYVSPGLPTAAWLEVGLMAYVAFGLSAGWVRRDFSFYPVQLMTLSGLGWVFGLSLVHSQRANGRRLAAAGAEAAPEAGPSWRTR